MKSWSDDKSVDLSVKETSQHKQVKVRDIDNAGNFFWVNYEMKIVEQRHWDCSVS